MEYSEIIERITNELNNNACKKFPAWPFDPIHAAGIVGEEAGEIMKAVLQWVYEPGKGTKQEDVEDELIQTAAMAIRMLKNMDHYKHFKTFEIPKNEKYEFAI